MSKHYQGEKINELVLLYKYSAVMPNGRRRTKWHCECSCGNTTEILDSNISKTYSCGHAKYMLIKEKKTKDLTGRKFNWLTVVEQAPDRISSSGRHIIRWKCLCDCGFYVDVDAAELVKGTVKSCGCHRFDVVRYRSCLTGEFLNSIEVLERLESKKYDSSTSTYSRWKCRCLECGMIFTAFGSALRRGQISCGCVNSKGEYEIGKILSNMGIKSEKQYSFSDLLSPYGNPLFFDFAIFDSNNNISLIEYQGIQHYKKQWNGFGDYQRETTDPLKKEYCKNNNIPLYEIKYDENIEEALNMIISKIYANSVPSSD